MENRNRSTAARATATAAAIFALLLAPSASAGPRFYDDDPLEREVESQDASGVKAWDIDLAFDLAMNLFAHPGDPTPGPVRAMNTNTVDEVPDSSWFTNRILARPLAAAEAVQGPNVGPGPASGKWTVIGAKTQGFTPGFSVRDSAGSVWFIKLDPPRGPESASGADVVASKIFWALGYHQAMTYVAHLDRNELVIDPKATVSPRPGHKRHMRQSDIDRILARGARREDGTYRVVAGARLPGRVLGGFRYHGTRPDDPNDVIPHEHRRELRALGVFGAWTNLVDLKALNTLDTLIEENGRGLVRHYLLDVGSTFGTGAAGPHDWDEGHDHLVQFDHFWSRLFLVGLPVQPWMTIPYREYPAIGRFEGERFDPTTWKPRVPTAAYRRMLPEDAFWAARRVKAFSDDLIRAMVKTGEYSDPAAEKHLADVLIQRRDKIARAYLPGVNPLVDFTLSPSGALTFANAAVDAGVAAAPRGYQASFAHFDNQSGALRPIGGPVQGHGPSLQAPAGLPDEVGSLVRASVRAVEPPHPSWAVPIEVTFRRLPAGFKLVGLERGAAAGSAPVAAAGH